MFRYLKYNKEYSTAKQGRTNIMNNNFAKKIINLKEAIDYQENSIVSKTITTNQNSSLTLFAFDKGEGLSEHTAPFDAFVQIVEGEAEVEISHKPYSLSAGESIILPAGRPHALKAAEKFKMLLTMIRQPASK